MADPRANPETAGGQSDVRPGSMTGTPRWVKVFGLVALVVIVLFVVVMLIGGGEHGPGRHTPGSGSDSRKGHTGPPPGFEHGAQQP